MRMYRVLIAAAVTLGCRTGYAQSASGDAGNSLGLMIGSEQVTGAIKNASLGGFSPGITVGGLAQFPVAPQLAIRADVMYHLLRDDVCGANHSCASSPNSSYVLSGSVAMIARLNDAATAWSPYVIGGVGAYSYDFEDGNIKALRPNHFGFQGGVGVEVRPRAARSTTMFIEARYMGIPPGGIVPIALGLRF